LVFVSHKNNNDLFFRKQKTPKKNKKNKKSQKKLITQEDGYLSFLFS